MLTKYGSVLEMLEEYIKVRIGKYGERKTNILDQFQRDIDLYEVKIRFL